MMRWHHKLPSGLTKLRIGAACLAAALCTGGWSAGANDVVFSSNARFRIPYQLDAAEIQRLRATEIQLHVSTDQGKKWRNVDTVPPVAGKFTFEAAQDGEYWFSVRTISEDGRHHPSGALVAGLKVHVDTQLPALSLDAKETEPGQIGLSWNAADDYLSPESLVVEYRTGEGEWSPVQVTKAAAGQTVWSVSQRGSVSIRGKVQDRAGNEATAESELTVTPPAAPEPAATPPATPSRFSRQPIAEGPHAAPQTIPNEPVAAAPTPAQQPAQPFETGQMTALPVINPNGTDYSQFVSQHEATTAATPASTPGPQLPNAATQPAITAPQQQPTGLPAQQTPVAPLQSNVPPQQAPPLRSLPPQSPEPTSSQRPRVQRVNSATFQIGYALEDVGPSGVSSVDLFLTEDGGRKWFHYGADEDRTSPFEVTVPADGSYGFVIRVRSGVGITQPPPQPGEAAEATIVVDRQPPQVSLNPLKQGNGQQPGQLLIEWSLEDEELAERPVALYYAAQASGPWEPITGWEANSGRYVWNLGPGTPRQVFVRLEARDAAGNVTRADSPTPLVIDMSRPSARILEVDPIPVSGRN